MPDSVKRLEAQGVDLDELTRFAQRLADVARPIARAYFRQGIVVERKADASPVTVVDRLTEKVLRAMIADRWPDHGLLGEEHGGERMDSRSLWVIDPVDGTKAFITGLPTFGTLIAFLLDGRPLVGVLEMPALAERWVGAAGAPTKLNDRACRTSGVENLASASLFATSPAMFAGGDAEKFEAVSRSTALTRFGADCYAYGLLASGHVDLVIEADMKPHDYLALVPVVSGAGGVITDWEGGGLGLCSSGRILAAATPALHDRARELLTG